MAPWQVFHCRRIPLAWLLLLGALASPQGASGQGTTRPDWPVPIQVSAAPALDRVISADLIDVPLARALEQIASAAGIGVTLQPGLAAAQTRITYRVARMTVRDAVTELLRGRQLVAFAWADGHLVFVEREAKADASAGTSPLRLGRVTGRVTDTYSGQPIASVEISALGGQRAVVSDAQGRYMLEALPARRWELRAQRLGYQPERVTITVDSGGTAGADFTLAPAAAVLSEVVTTATGDRARRELGHAIATVVGDSASKFAPSSADELLSGRAASVQVLRSTGLVGGGSRIRIRGLSSAAVSNDPLVIVDGIRVDANPTAGGLMPILRISRLDDINPDDIERVDVVRGPSAATLYGTDAANGVIVIQTKRGANAAPRWQAWFDASRLSIPSRFPTNYQSWGHTSANAPPVHCLLTDAAAGACQRDSVTTFNALEDPATSPLAVGHTRRAGLSVAGGVPLVRFYSSGELTETSGPYRMPPAEADRLDASGKAPRSNELDPNALQRVSARLNVGVTPDARTSFDLSAGVVSSRTRLPMSDGQGVFGLLRNGLLGPGYRDSLNGSALYPFGDILQVRNEQDVDRFTGSMTGRFEPREWLTIRTSAGADVGAQYDDVLQRQSEGPDFADYRAGRRAIRRVLTERYTLGIGGTFARDLGDAVRSRASAGAQYYRDRASWMQATGAYLAPGSVDVNGGAHRDAVESTTESVTLGLYVEEALNFRERLFATAAVRFDNGTNFSQATPAVVYPKASLSWVARDAPSSGVLRALSNLRFRSAFGASGVQPPQGASLVYYTPLATLVDGSGQPGVRLTGLGNSQPRREQSVEGEVGADAGLWNQRVILGGTLFDKRSRDALVSAPTPPSLGATTGALFINLGSVRNTGAELEIIAKPLDRPRLSWDISVSGSRTRNRLVTLGADTPPIVLGALHQRHVPGYPVFGFWDRPILGWNDADHDGVLTESEVRVGDTARYLGSSVPLTEAALNTGLSLWNHRITIGGQLDYRGDFVVENTTENWRCITGLNCRAVNDPRAPLSEQARAVAARSAVLGRTAAGYIEDGTFLRLRELAVTWAIPERLVTWAGLPVRVSLLGRNLALWTRYGGLDPESAQSGNDYASDGFVTPQLRYWSLRVAVGR